MPFLDEDVVVRQSGEDEFELVQPLRYQTGDLVITIPAGSRTDFASVPRPFVWLLPRYGVYTRAAILHDYLNASDQMSSAQGDRLFVHALAELGTPLIRRWMMWAAVRLGAGLRGSGPLEILGILLIAIFSLAFLAIPASIILIWLVLFYLIELIAWPFSHTKRPPEFTVKTQ